MKISARNQFQGSIATLYPGSVHTEVEIALGNGDRIVGVVTNHSVQALGLAVGKPVLALVKASAVMVMTDAAGYALSARNVLDGVVSQVVNGPVSAEVTLSLPGGTPVYATITHDSAEALGIQVGATASVVFKASAVMIAFAK